MEVTATFQETGQQCIVPVSCEDTVGVLKVNVYAALWGSPRASSTAHRLADAAVVATETDAWRTNQHFLSPLQLSVYDDTGAQRVLDDDTLHVGAANISAGDELFVELHHVDIKSPADYTSDTPWSVTVSTSGRWCVSATRGPTDLWNLETGSKVRSFPAEAGAGIAVLLGERYVAGVCGRAIRLFDLETGAATQTFAEEHTGRITCLTGTSCGRALVSASADHRVIVWDVETGASMQRIVMGGTPTCLEVAPSANWLVASTESAISLSVVDFTAVCRTANAVFDATEPGAAATLQGHRGEVTALALSPCSRMAVSGSDDTDLRVWDLAGAVCLQRLRGHGGRVCCVAWSRCSQWIVSGSVDMTIIEWDAFTGVPMHWHRHHFSPATCLAVSPCSRWVISGARGNYMYVRDMQRGNGAEAIRKLR